MNHDNDNGRLHLSQLGRDYEAVGRPDSVRMAARTG
jgi:hypothetical protein